MKADALNGARIFLCVSGGIAAYKAAALTSTLVQRGASVEVAMGKARTAAIFRRPSKVFEDQVRDGRVAAIALPGATPLQGGIPITVNGKVIGAIGASGNSPQEDEDIAKAGAAAVNSVLGTK